MFFYTYAAYIISEFLAVSGIIPFASGAYPYFVALHLAMMLATLWCLFGNGFVPFQFIEDGTPMSLWTLRISTALVFLGTFIDRIL